MDPTLPRGGKICRFTCRNTIDRPVNQSYTGGVGKTDIIDNSGIGGWK
ncbi:hypothetical protein ACFYVR_11435 [Rhodococcus sp. NPDC003318]